ncbi:hypothetical protein [Paraburkholderia adhaesiva]|uniref:hypothetical protein n=1 Tax=Paraburkholderia adhaesiva TaxID=2883244 RepID=UPI001F237CD6|nr:hypothetical protein [Paraburkholderia adhaesiva]
MAGPIALLWMLSPPKRIVEHDTAQPVTQHGKLDHVCYVIGASTASGHAISLDRKVCTDRFGQTTDMTLAHTS